ncbi:rhomboid family intramembrane serine protease [Corynebacterium camporealensis]
MTTTNQGASHNYTHRGRISTGIRLAVGFLVVTWGVHLVNFILGGTLSVFGIQPRDPMGLLGIIFAPVLHGNWEHLMSNSVPGAIFCFLIGLSGRKAFWEVTVIVALVAGMGTWLFGDVGTLHIGASSLVYGWLAYLVIRGIFNRSLLQILLGIVIGLMYSGLIWGVLPIYEGVSWQGHLFGAIGGILAGMAITSDDPVKAVRRA